MYLYWLVVCNLIQMIVMSCSRVGWWFTTVSSQQDGSWFLPAGQFVCYFRAYAGSLRFSGFPAQPKDLH